MIERSVPDASSACMGTMTVRPPSLRNLASQGETVEASLTNLREALELYFESAEPIVASTQPTLVATIDVPVKAAS